MPGQFLRKNFASSHDVIWEQRVRPSQRYGAEAGGTGIETGSDGNSSCRSGVVLIVGGADVRFPLASIDGETSGSGVVIGAAGGDCCTTA